MQDALKKIEELKTEKVFPYVLKNASTEMFNAHQIINHVVGQIKQQDAELIGILSPMLAILDNLSSCLLEHADMLNSQTHADSHGPTEFTM